MVAEFAYVVETMENSDELRAQPSIANAAPVSPDAYWIGF